MDLKNKKVIVIGFGKSGQAAAKLLLKKGAEVIVSDVRPKEEIGSQLVNKFEAEGVIFETGGHKSETFLSSDLVVVSPGVPRTVYEICLKKGIPVISEIELAWQFLPFSYSDIILSIKPSKSSSSNFILCFLSVLNTGSKTLKS